jgi:hypothetical protein
MIHTNLDKAIKFGGTMTMTVMMSYDSKLDLGTLKAFTC